MHWELDRTIHTPGMKAPGPKKFVPHARLAKMFTIEQSRRDCQPYHRFVRFWRGSPSSCLSRQREGRAGDGVVRTKLALTREDIFQFIGTSREPITSTVRR
jgi:hypothetical protein